MFKKLALSAVVCCASPMLWAFGTSDLAQTLQKPQSVQGMFTQQRYLKSLNKPMATSGHFVLLPKKGLLWQMQKPFASTLRVRSDGIKQWNGQNWVAPASGRVGQAQQVKLFLDLLAGNTSGLSNQFDMQLSGNAKRWALKLNPKSLLMKQIFSSINIQGGSTVRQIELNEKQGDRTVMTFSHNQLNEDLDSFAQQALQ